VTSLGHFVEFEFRAIAILFKACSVYCSRDHVIAQHVILKNECSKLLWRCGRVSEEGFFCLNFNGISCSGASSSNIIIASGSGEIISRADGLGTNHWVGVIILSMVWST